MQILQFISDALPRPSRQSAIEQFWSQSLLMDIDLEGATAAKFSMRGCELPGVSVSSFAGSTSQMTRSANQALAAENELVLCVARDSQVKVHCAGKPGRLFAPGEAHVWLGDRATSCSVDGPYRATMIRIPAVSLVSASLDLDYALERGVPPDTGELRLLIDYAESLLTHAGPLGAQAASSIATHLRDLAVLALRPSRDTEELRASQSLRSVRLQRIKADICAHLCQPELSANWIAGREGISPRYLRELLASNQTSFSEFVLQQRLELARLRLSQPAAQALPIATIAFDSGFGDLSYFCRTFKQHFGMTPSDARAQARVDD